MLTLQLAICSTHGLLKYMKISHIPFIKKKNIHGMHTLAFRLGMVISLLISSQIWACRGGILFL